MSVSLRAVLLAACAVPAFLPPAARAAEVADGGGGPTVEQLVVTAPSSIANLTDTPNTSSTVTAEQVARTLSLVTPEDTIRYLPNVLIRQRHIGDTQSPVTTRTSGVGASARSLIYVDGILISSLIGNNNTSASPKWGLISANAVERVDVLNGPFAAAFAGNSIGSVVAFTTRMPDRLEAGMEAQAGVQGFSRYGDDDDYRTWRVAADLGDRVGSLAFRLSYNHLDSRSQPLAYVTATVPAAASQAGTVVTGAFADANRAGVPIRMLGASGLEHQAQDNVSGRAAWDVSPDVTLAYTFGLFVNDDDSTVNSYLRNAAGAPVYSGALNIDGRLYNVAPSAFSNGVYRFDETLLAQGLSLASHTDGTFDYDVTATAFEYVKSRQRVATGPLPAAFSGGPGTLARLDGTGWRTLDANGKWRPSPEHAVTFGLHYDRIRLDNPRYALADWRSGPAGARIADSQGRTRTEAAWAQDVWSVTPALTLTTGLRYERWTAYDGLNYSAAPPLDTAQPTLKHDRVSPKAVLAWTPADGWTLKGSVAIANRFPTVTELYQAVTTGLTLSVSDPDLKPERALSSELSLERRWSSGQARVALFDERIDDALLSQTAVLSGANVNFVQNIDRTRATGVEVVAEQHDALAPGLSLSAWVTYLDTEIEKDAAFAPAVGKRLPQLPRWRGAVVATYSGVPRLDLTAAARYAGRAFAMIDNSDTYANTYQGFGAWFSLDAHARYRVTERLTAALGVTNALNRAYFVFHPFPQRTVIADLKMSY